MALFNVKVRLEVENEAGVEASASVTSIEKGQAGLTIDWKMTGTATGRVLRAGRLKIDQDGRTASNDKNNPVDAKPPNNSDGRLVDFLALCQEWLAAAVECGEIPSVITIGGVGG